MCVGAVSSLSSHALNAVWKSFPAAERESCTVLLSAHHASCIAFHVIPPPSLRNRPEWTSSCCVKEEHVHSRKPRGAAQHPRAFLMKSELPNIAAAAASRGHTLLPFIVTMDRVSLIYNHHCHIDTCPCPQAMRGCKNKGDKWQSAAVAEIISLPSRRVQTNHILPSLPKLSIGFPEGGAGCLGSDLEGQKYMLYFCMLDSINLQCTLFHPFAIVGTALSTCGQ